jgi:hypothetical protein
MGPLESALIGYPLIGSGIGLFAWGVLRWRAWERGEVSSLPRASFRPAPAPGRWRISFGIALVFVGAIMLAPFVASI